MVTNDASYGSASTEEGATQVVRRHSVRNCIEWWIQELKRRIDAFYASFTGHDVEIINNWLRQFAWVWNVCLTYRCRCSSIYLDYRLLYAMAQHNQDEKILAN